MSHSNAHALRGPGGVYNSFESGALVRVLWLTDRLIYIA
jgi:hypothetical protein